MGISTFVEFGAGRVLTSLIKRIDRTVELVNVEDLASAEKLAASDCSL
jgi:[acyl-carrier-protein] S-malonyltransferase